MSNAVTTNDTWDPADIDAALQRAGAIDEQGQTFNRIKVDGANFIADDNAWQTPVRGDGPAMVVRIIAPPEQYQAKWFNDADAQTAERPEIAGKFCKSRFDVPSEAREFGTGGTSCRECPFNPFEQGVSNKCAWKGDIRFQVFPEGDDVELTGEEPEYVMTIPTTGMIEWKGTAKNPGGGAVSEKNFIKQLGELAISQSQALWGFTVNSGASADRAIGMALTALNSGLVAAELRSLKKVNEQYGREWYLPSFTPIHIEAGETTPEIVAGATPPPDDPDDF